MGYIVSVDEVGTRQGSLSLSGLSRKYVRKFEVITSDAEVGQLQVELAAGLPRIGASYVVPYWSDLGAIVTSISARQEDPEANTYWTVEVEYNSRTSDPQKSSGGGGGGGQPGAPQSANPLLEPAQIVWGKHEVLVARLRTIDELPRSQERAIANSAGTPYDPPPQVPVPYRTLTITRNEERYRPFITSLYENTVNDRPFQGRPAYSCLCKSITAQDGYKDNYRYQIVRYEFHFAEHHDIELLDKGSVYFNSDDTVNRKLIPFATSTGMTMGEGLLNGQGLALPRNAAGAFTQAPVNLRFEVYYSQNFDDLDLPDPAYQ